MSPLDYLHTITQSFGYVPWDQVPGEISLSFNHGNLHLWEALRMYVVEILKNSYENKSFKNLQPRSLGSKLSSSHLALLCNIVDSFSA